MGKEIEPLITIDRVAELMGLSKRGVEKMMARKQIPSVKLSRRCLRFRWSEVEAAINRYRQREIY
jgi:excisionase family DNA binding protein